MIYILTRRELMCNHKNWTSISDKFNQFHYKYRYGSYPVHNNKRFEQFLIYLERYGFWNPKIDNEPKYRPSCGSQTEDEFWQDYYRYSKQRNEKRERLNKATQLIITHMIIICLKGMILNSKHL